MEAIQEERRPMLCARIKLKENAELQAIFPPFDFSEVFFLEMCMLDIRRAAVKAYRFRGRLRNL